MAVPIYSLVLVCSVIYFDAIFADDENQVGRVVVDTKYGKWEGFLSGNKMYYEFCGIRYAIPVKFRAPVPPEQHLGIYKADRKEVLCPQFNLANPSVAKGGVADCLVLNVFTPNVRQNPLLPVMFFIHGGQFGVGSGSPTFYSPEFLVNRKVVVVTVNYRLNYHGFLNLGILEAPGNAGLKDIRAALRWVQDNIGEFGGDRNSVTVFGQGSGGIAAIYLTLTATAAGLFHRIISQSGFPFSTIAFDPNPVKTATKVAKCLEVNSDDPRILLQLYSDKSVEMIEDAISKQMHSQSIFVPSVEREFPEEEAFLIDTPYNILKNGTIIAVPMIVGINTVEGLAAILDHHTFSSQVNRIYNEDYSAIDQRNLENCGELRDVLKKTYFTETESEETIVGGLVNLYTDFGYVGPMSLFVQMYTERSLKPVFQYLFNYIGNRNLGRLLTKSVLEATTNKDELFYLFALDRMPLPMDASDRRMILFMTTMWTNFAKFDTPTPDGEQWNNYPMLLAISANPAYVEPILPERASFWRRVFLTYAAEILPAEAPGIKNFERKESTIVMPPVTDVVMLYSYHQSSAEYNREALAQNAPRTLITSAEDTGRRFDNNLGEAHVDILMTLLPSTSVKTKPTRKCPRKQSFRSRKEKYRPNLIKENSEVVTPLTAMLKALSDQDTESSLERENSSELMRFHDLAYALRPAYSFPGEKYNLNAYPEQVITANVKSGQQVHRKATKS